MTTGPRFLVLDNDALVLLAGADLLGLTLESLGLGPGDFRYNGTFPYYFPKKIRPKLPVLLAVRVDAAILAGKPLAEAPTVERQSRLQQIEGIDAGEAVLFSVVAEQKALYLTTNDKRALTCLSRDERAASVRRELVGKILSIEHVLDRLLSRNDPTDVIARCRAAAVIDKMFQVVFSDHNAANPAECQHALDSYRRAIEAACGPDLFLSK